MTQHLHSKPVPAEPSQGHVRMNGESNFPNAVIASLVNRTRDYLASQVGIQVSDVRRDAKNFERMEFQQSTAIIGVGGSIGILVAFSLPQEIIDVLYERLTANFDVPAGEEDLYRRETVSEMANVIIGNCTADFSTDGELVTISPPIVLESAKQIHRMKDAKFDSISMVTNCGCFDINLVGPCDMFDAYLYYAQ